MTKVPESGYKIIGLWISGLQRKISFRNLYFPLKVIVSYFKAKQIIGSFKPDAVIGFGGYASAPIMMAGTSRRIPALIQEQNSYAGLANKRMAKKAEKICVAYPGMEKYFPADKIVVTGNPVRKDIINPDDKKGTALKHFGFTSEKKTILVIGGSLGARTINESMLQEIDKIIKAGVQLIWQTGKFYHEEMLRRTKSYDKSNIRVLEFLREMDLAYAAADVVISRAGALSVSEICLTGRPAIFVPSPNVAEDHQTKNAQSLVDNNAAVIIKDQEAREKLVMEALELIKDTEKQEKLSKNISGLAKPNAAEDIVKEIVEAIN